MQRNEENGNISKPHSQMEFTGKKPVHFYLSYVTT